MTSDDVVTLLRNKCAGNASEWARANNISTAYVSEVLRKRKEPAGAILKALKLKRVLSYEPLRPGK